MNFVGYVFLVASAVSFSAHADDVIFASPVSPEQVVESLANEALRGDEFRNYLADHLEAQAEISDVPARVERNKTLDLRVSLPEGAGASFAYTPIAPITVGVSLSSLLGATVSGSAEVTFNVMWPKKWTRKCALAVTGRVTHLRFTGLTDEIANETIQQIYGKSITVKMAGAAMNGVTGLGGIDCVFNNGVHLFAKGGWLHQVGETKGGDRQTGEITLRDWNGPAADLGIGWAF